MVAQLRRRQHVVSKFYLRGFADENEQIKRVALPGDQSHVLSLSNASVIKDFYTITLPDGTRSDAIESAFGEIEGPAATALRSVTSSTWPRSTQDRTALAAWIALQHLRSEDVRAFQGGVSAEMIKLIVGVSGKEALSKHIEDTTGRAISDEELSLEWQDIVKQGGPDLKPDVKKHAELLMSMLPGTTAYLNDCHWTLYPFRQRAILTSDHPVSLVVDEDYPSHEGIGILTADLFLIPLTRRSALTIQPRQRLRRYTSNVDAVPDSWHPGTTQIARSINQETANRAHRYIYERPDEDPIGALQLPKPIGERIYADKWTTSFAKRACSPTPRPRSVALHRPCRANTTEAGSR